MDQPPGGPPATLDGTPISDTPYGDHLDKAGIELEKAIEHVATALGFAVGNANREEVQSLSVIFDQLTACNGGLTGLVHGDTSYGAAS